MVPRITPLTPSDRDDWGALWRGYLDFYEASLSDEQTAHTFARLVDDGAGLHGAIARDDDGHAIGFVHWLTHANTWSSQPYCYLEDLFVSPAARGGGTGRALIVHVEQWAREVGCAKVYWMTQAHNATARRLYDAVANDTEFVQYAIPLG